MNLPEKYEHLFHQNTCTRMFAATLFITVETNPKNIGGRIDFKKR